MCYEHPWSPSFLAPCDLKVPPLTPACSLIVFLARACERTPFLLWPSPALRLTWPHIYSPSVLWGIRPSTFWCYCCHWELSPIYKTFLSLILRLLLIFVFSFLCMWYTYINTCVYMCVFMLQQGRVNIGHLFLSLSTILFFETKILTEAGSCRFCWAGWSERPWELPTCNSSVLELQVCTTVLDLCAGAGTQTQAPKLA